MKKHPAIAVVRVQREPGRDVRHRRDAEEGAHRVREVRHHHARPVPHADWPARRHRSTKRCRRPWRTADPRCWITCSWPMWHPRVYDAILGRRKAGNSGALAIIETDTVAANVRAAEAALKGTPVDLIEIRLADTGLSGRGLSLYQGALPDIEAAIEIVTRYVDQSGGQLPLPDHLVGLTRDSSGKSRRAHGSSRRTCSISEGKRSDAAPGASSGQSCRASCTRASRASRC